MRAALSGIFISSLFALPGCNGPEPQTHSEAKTETPFYVVDHYDPARDPAADLEMAVQRAKAENKRILLVIGGEWCIWCEYLANFLHDNEAVHDAFADSFVVMKVNWSPENKNEDFLGQYPESEGYPDFFILEADGSFLAQQGTGVLEEGKSYDEQKMLDFAAKWKKAA